MRDHRVERLLESEGIKYEFIPNYDIDKVKFDAKAQTQIRIKGTDPDKVDEYAAAMKRQGGPRTFPAIVVAKDGSGISGKHRHGATRNGGYGGIDVYVCDTVDPDVIRRLRILFNVIEGDREPREDRLLHALHLANGGGYSQAEAAEVVGLPRGTVQGFIRRESFRGDMREAGVPAAVLSCLSGQAMEAIRGVPRTDLQKTLCRVASRYRMSGSDARSLALDVRDAPNDSEALQVIVDFEKKVEAATSGGKRRAVPSPTAKVEAAIKRTENALKAIERDRFTDEGAVVFALRLRDFAAFVNGVAEEL